MPLGDTIVALSTPAGESALAMIRLSGPACESVCQAVLQRKAPPLARTATMGSYYNMEGSVLDQSVFLLFPDERSYTGEPMLEVHCHGNPLIVQKIIEDLIARGCRMAQAGEFTRTAFQNGKMDLSQAEAVADLICAQSELALGIAQRQLAGALGDKVQEIQDELLAIIAAVEAYIDFPEDDLPGEAEYGPLLMCRQLSQSITTLIDTQRYRELLHDGIKTVIVGEPNAGKSSLLNFLVGEERAIVSPEPGTTRDFIQERIAIGPYCMQIIDTAGLREAGSAVEAQGIVKTLERVKEADFHIIVVDSSVPSPALPDELMARITAGNTLVLVNKVDLESSQGSHGFLDGVPRLSVSLKTGEGLKGLKDELQRLLERDCIVPTEQSVVVSVRHAAALSQVRDRLESACEAILRGDYAELMASDLRLAVEALGEIVGRVDNELMLDKLFGEFCIGK